MSDAFQELMGRMKSAVDNSKTARERVKTASIEELEEPGDILANQIHNMTSELERTSFPEEYAAKHANDITDDDDDVVKEADDDDDVEIDDADVVESSKAKVPAVKKELDKGAAENEPGFGLSVEADLSNPIVAAGFDAELREHEPVIKQAMAKILAHR